MKTINAHDAQLEVKVTCPNCLHRQVLAGNLFYVDASTSPCDLCGDHGSVEFDFTCDGCQRHTTVSLKEW